MKKSVFILFTVVMSLLQSYSQEHRLAFTAYRDTAYIQHLIKEADALPADSLADSAIGIYTQVAHISEGAGYTLGAVYAYSQISSYQYYKKMNYTASLQAAVSALPYLQKLEKKDYYLIPTIFNLKGLNQFRIAMYDSAIDNFRFSLSEIDRLNIDQPTLKSQILHNIGSVFVLMEQLSTALSYYHKALEIPGAGPSQLARVYDNMGNAYAILNKDIDSASYWWSRAIAIYREQKQYKNLQYTYANMSLAWQMPGYENLSRSAQYLDSAIQTHPSTAYDHYMVLKAAAYIAYNKGNYVKAIDYCNRVIRMRRPVGDINALQQAYWLLSYCYAFLGDKEQMKAYHLKYEHLNKSINYKRISQSINGSEVKYRVAEKERALAVSQAQTYRQRNWLYLSGGSFLLLGTLAFGYLRNFRQRRRLDTEKIHALEQRNRLEELNIRMEAEEEERIRISGELHDSLGVLISAAKLNNTLLKKNIGSEGQRIEDICKDGAGLLEDIHQEMRSIAHNLKPEYYLSHKSLGDALKQIAGKLESDDFCIRISEFGSSSRLHPRRSFAVYRILEEVINNSLKHAKGSQLEIQLVYTDTHLNISAEDDGIGFDPSQLNRGIGLDNIQRRAAQIGAHLSLNAEKNKGVAYMLEIPY